MTSDKDLEKPDPKKRLGRGLDALFSDEEEFGDDSPLAGVGGSSSSGAPGTGRAVLGIDQLEPGTYQPREKMDEASLKELSESIAEHGVLQPLLVRKHPSGDEGRYEIIAGERRWRASQLAMLHEVPVTIRDLSDQQAMELGLIENLQREDLNIVEEAYGYARLVDQFGYTQEQVGKSLGKSRSHVANTLRLLSLPDSVKEYIRQGSLTAGHARALVTADDPETLAKEIISQGLSVREAEKFSGGSKKKTGKSVSGKAPARSAEKDVDTLALEEELSGLLGMRVQINVASGQTGTGNLTIDFKSLDQLDEVLHRLSHYPGRQQTG